MSRYWRKRRGAISAAIILAAMAAIILPLDHSHSAGAKTNFLREIRAREQAGEIEILIHTSAPANFRVVSDTNNKIVIEFSDTRLARAQAVPVRRGQVVQVRAAQHSVKPDYSVWLVIELAKPSRYVVEPRSGNLTAVRLPLDYSGLPAPTPVSVPAGPAPARPALAGLPPLPLGYASPQEIPSGFIIDLHSDSILRMMEYGGDITPMSGNPDNQVWLKCTVPLLRQGGMGAQVFAVYTPKGQGFDWAVESIRLFYDVLSTYPDLAFAGSVAEVRHNLAAGKISALLGLEGGEAIENDVDHIDYFHRLGVRYMGLTWNRTNLIADATRDKQKPYGGLSPFGEQVVRRMNQVGMMVDLSHASHETISDVLALSTDPVIASHTNAYAVNPHWRNLTDEEIRGICRTGGVVGISFYRTFLSSARPVYASSIVDHILRVAMVGGMGCPALGSDFDGGIRGPVDLQNIGEIGTLTRELSARGFSQEQIDMVYGKNFMRVLAAMDQKHPAPAKPDPQHPVQALVPEHIIRTPD